MYCMYFYCEGKFPFARIYTLYYYTHAHVIIFWSYTLLYYTHVRATCYKSGRGMLLYTYSKLTTEMIHVQTILLSVLKINKF